MKISFKKKWASLISIMLLMSILSGCLGSTNVDNNTSGESDGEKSTDKGTITMWGWDANYIEVVSKEFNKVYPDINIELTNVGAEDYLQKVQTTMASGGELPDILWGGKKF